MSSEGTEAPTIPVDADGLSGDAERGRRRRRRWADSRVGGLESHLPFHRRNRLTVASPSITATTISPSSARACDRTTDVIPVADVGPRHAVP